MLPDELWSTLLRFHREVVKPDMYETVLRFHREVAYPEIVGTLREEMAVAQRQTQANFDAVWARFDRLESEYQALKAAVARIEARRNGAS